MRLRCRPSGRGCEPPAAQCRRDLPEAQCLASGGDFGAHGLAPDPSCLCPAPDAGRSCTRAGDCRGLCLADSGDSAAGRCSEHVTEFGCFTLLDGDGLRRALCID